MRSRGKLRGVAGYLRAHRAGELMFRDLVVQPFVAAPEGADIVAARQLLSGGDYVCAFDFATSAP